MSGVCSHCSLCALGKQETDQEQSDGESYEKGEFRHDENRLCEMHEITEGRFIRIFPVEKNVGDITEKSPLPWILFPHQEKSATLSRNVVTRSTDLHCAKHVARS